MAVGQWNSTPDPAVDARLSPLAQRRTALRESVYRRLVDAPSRHWTVGELSEDIGAGLRGRPDGIRSVLYVLLADRVLTTIPGQRALTVALTLSGVRALRVLLTSWHDSR